MTKIQKKFLPKILAYLVLLAIIFWFIFFIKNHLSDFSIVRFISGRAVFLLLLFNFIALVFEGLILKIILEPFQIRLKIKEWFGLNILSSFGNIILPFGGWGVRGIYLQRKYQFNYADFLSVLAVVTIFELIVFSLGGIIGLIYWQVTTGLTDKVLLLIFGLVASMCLGFIILPIKIKDGQNVWQKRLFKMSESWRNLKNQKVNILKIILVMFFYFLVNAVIFFLAARSFGLAASLPFTFIPTALSNYTLIIRILPASAGFYEGAVIYSLKLLNLNLAQGLLVAELTRFSYLIWLLVLTPIFSYVLLKKIKLGN